MRTVVMHTNEGAYSAVLGKPGRKFTPYVCLSGYPVRKRRILNRDVERYCRQLTLGKREYPVTRAVNNMLRVGRQYGITKGARMLLKEAKS